MSPYTRVVVLLSAVTLFSVTAPLFAESAPVYDADSMPQQFDGDSDQGAQAQQDVPPPAPSSEGGFVPSQSSSSSQSSSQSSSAPEPSTSSMSMDQRMRRLEQQVSNMQGSEGVARLDSLQDQIQALRGQVEQLTHQLQQAQAQQKILYVDLDKRLSQLGDKSTKRPAAGVTDTSSADDSDTGAAAASSGAKTSAKIAAAKQAAKATAGVDAAASDASAAKKSAADQPNVAEEQQIYQTAYNLIKAKKYSDAVDALQGMLKKYPSGQFASNAHYWLGELYGLMGKNDLALTEFGTVIETYPDSPRVSDAQLKVGLIYLRISKMV